jgi:hypothetical protein
MSEQPTPSFHDLFGTVNGIGLQLEVLALAFERADAALHESALSSAREAVVTLGEQIEALRKAGAEHEA